MKQSIAWHKACLENQRDFLMRRREEAARMYVEIQILEKSIMLRNSKIIRAEAMGKDGFDADKFGVKK